MAEAAQHDRHFIPDANAQFFKETSLRELVSGVKPLASMDDLALDDLQTEEAISFLRAIEE
jgi:hypothetical protein